MINFQVGNILVSHTEALVNTVNTVGVMGKGIALLFKKVFPIAMEEYLKAVKDKSIQIGKVQVVKTGSILPKYIINFPTKVHWRYPSKIEFIDKGLYDLVIKIEEYSIKSISIPPLGCGNGKLNWSEVKPLMIKYLEPLSDHVNIIIFEPGYSDQKMIQKKEVKLTSARAMLIYLLKQYQILGYSVNLLVAQKLAYLLQRFGEPMNLEFEKGPYGPYSHRLLHLLKYLNGYYIWFKEEDNKPGTTLSIDSTKYTLVEEYVANEISDEKKTRIKKVIKAIEGFESPFGLELLATVDFIIQNTHTSQFDMIEKDIHNWTTRKRNIMKPYHIEVATKQVNSFSSL
jgi:O-acetyl-ADP-ribose deacetylase (regulator of RNase III)